MSNLSSPKCCVVGTFDVENYGDLLFPIIARWRLSNFELVVLSPTNSSPGFVDAATSIPLSCLGSFRADGFLVGGGNIVHLNPSTVHPYSKAPLAYASMQLSVAAFSQKHHLPVVYNSPSVTGSRLGIVAKHYLGCALSKARYLAFRDAFSVQRVRELTNRTDIALVPDTAFDISRVWPREQACRALECDYFVVHTNRRYGGGAETVAKAIETIAEETRLTPVLLPIGPCHGDVKHAHEVANKISMDCKVVDDLELFRFAQYIANSCFYIGSSMHGFITALSYRRPSILVLNPNPMDKFYGAVDAARLPRDVIMPSWEVAARDYSKVGTVAKESLDVIFSSLDEHWENIERALLEAEASDPGCCCLVGWRSVVRLEQMKNQMASSVVHAARVIARTVF